MKRSYLEHRKTKGASCLGLWCLLTGPEQHLKREALGILRAEANAVMPGEEPSWEVLDASSASARDVIARSRTKALFGGARVIVIREAQRLPEAEQKELASAVGPLPTGVAVALITGESSDRTRPAEVRKALRSAIEQHGIVIEFPAMKMLEAVKWATMRAKELGKTLEPAAARKLVEQRAGVGLGELAEEVEKLSLFAGPRKTITAADVEEVTPKLVEESIFRMLDAVRERHSGRAVTVLRSLLQERRENPNRVLWMLADAMRLVWQVKALGERGWKPGEKPDEETAALLPQEARKNAIAQLKGRKAFLWERTLAAASGLTWSQLARAMQAIHGCDLAIKGIRGKVADEHTALELLVIQLCTGLDLPVWENPGGERMLG